jgi:hypothetical protein
MNSVDVNVYDNLLSEELRKEVWEYINNQTWYATYKPVGKYTSTYIPSQEFFIQETHKSMSLRFPTMWMHRTCFSSDEVGLETNHPIIWKLWKTINSFFDNKYVIEGCPEDMPVLDNPEWAAPLTENLELEQGWRVYANGQLDESVKRSHGIHRDTIDIADSTSRTILYVANLEWYPSWFAECVFYPDDPMGYTGDHQQFQRKHSLGQGRGFNIGWGDKGKIVSPVPGRIIDYDGRTLHTTRPTAVWANEIRKTIAFRVRLKS